MYFSIYYIVLYIYIQEPIKNEVASNMHNDIFHFVQVLNIKYVI